MQTRRYTDNLELKKLLTFGKKAINMCMEKLIRKSFYPG